MHRLAPVLFDDGLSFVLVEFLVSLLSDHVLEAGAEVLELDLAVDVVVLVHPAAFIFEHGVKWGSRPVSLFQNSQESIEMDFFHEDLFSFSWVWDLLTYGAILDWPVESSVFLHVMILS